ncbi:MAG TPA: metal ABC transporter permease [Pirellulales bacterium]|jgi:manganese/zinc/iron transport system permease protein|nr:metal ABC transporter permease [Pirellulales bacterium]
MIDHNTAVVLVGTSLLGAGAGLIGCFAVLRGRALLGDALGHAALPGVCLAFLLLGRRSLAAMLVGAWLTGVLGILVVAALRRATRIKEDAAIGIVLSVFFGAGVALSGYIQKRVTEGSKAGFDTYIFGKAAGMLEGDLYWISAAALAALLAVVALFKELRLVTFDASFARVQGWPAASLDLLLMGLLSLIVVIGLPAVGAVLVAALLILPAAAARFWTERLGTMLVVAGSFGLSMGAAGTAISAAVSRAPTGPVIVLVGACLFGASVLVAPRRGAVARLVDHVRFRRRLLGQAMWRAVYEALEPRWPAPRPVAIDELSQRTSYQPARLQGAVRRAEHDGLLTALSDGRYLATAAGLALAARVTRGYRLWQRFLAEQPELAGTFARLDVESADDLLPPEVVADLEAGLRRDGRLPAAPREEPTP